MMHAERGNARLHQAAGVGNDAPEDFFEFEGEGELGAGGEGGFEACLASHTHEPLLLRWPPSGSRGQARSPDCGAHPIATTLSFRPASRRSLTPAALRPPGTPACRTPARPAPPTLPLDRPAAAPGRSPG